MRLVLALPHLLAFDPAVLARLPGLARIAAAAGTPVRVEAGLESAWIVAAGAPADASLAQLAAAGAGLDAGAAAILFADPVTLVAGRDDVLFRGRVEDLTEAEAQTLVALLNAHFASDGVVLHAPRANAWFVTADALRTLATTPPAAIRGAIYPHLPRGEAAKAWRRWLSEMQMLLHEHAINAKRERAGMAPVTGVWIWGGGRQDWPDPLPDTVWVAPAGRTGDVVRGLARRAGRGAITPPASLAAVAPADSVHAVLPPALTADDVAALDAAWLAPAADALARGTFDTITLIGDAGGAAWRWDARRPAFLRRLRERFGAPPFVVPLPQDE
jgi:hypothetical protein